MAAISPSTSTALAPMISVVPPSVTSASASLNVVTPTITYNQLVNSLGTYDYGAIFFYISATTFQQINQPFFYTHFDAAGNQMSTYLPFSVDPYQQLPSLYYDKVSPEEIVFDGFASLTFTSFANSLVYFKMYALIEYMAGGLERFGDNNFEQVEKLEGFTFFEDYCNYLIDQE